MLTITLPSYYGAPLTPAEIIYLRDVLRAEFDCMVTPCDNPRLRGAWLFRRFRVEGSKVTEVWLQDASRNIVARLTEHAEVNWNGIPTYRTGPVDWSNGECDEWEKYAKGKRTPPHMRKRV